MPHKQYFSNIPDNNKMKTNATCKSSCDTWVMIKAEVVLSQGAGDQHVTLGLSMKVEVVLVTGSWGSTCHTWVSIQEEVAFVIGGWRM
jgi:hypothetical protein